MPYIVFNSRHDLLFLCVRPPPELLPVLGLLEWYMTPTLDTAQLCSSRAGFDLGPMSDRFEELSTSIPSSFLRRSMLV